ncbi:hypothetical protein PWT90_00347 [Aphanocladium album]|nr:hypothetical protein PWT90_00347 [Aphanocladium album]
MYFYSYIARWIAFAAILPISVRTTTYERPHIHSFAYRQSENRHHNSESSLHHSGHALRRSHGNDGALSAQTYAVGNKGCTLRLRDDPFISLTEAHFELEPMWNNVIKGAIHPGPEGPVFQQDGQAFAEQFMQYYKERHSKWQRKPADLRVHCCELGERTAFSVLDLRAETIKVLLYNYAFKVSIISWDSCEAALEMLVNDAKLLIELRYAASQRHQTSTTSAALSSTPGTRGRVTTLSPITNETLYLVARLCHSPVLRRRACDSLAHDYYLAPSVPTLLYMHLADTQIDIEEAEWRKEFGSKSRITLVGADFCDCDNERAFICDGHRIYQTALDESSKENYPNPFSVA